MTEEDYNKSFDLCKDSILIREDKFEYYLRKNINDFLVDIDMTILDNRKLVKDFLSRLSGLYLNCMLNGQDDYLLGDREKDNSQKGREIIKEYLDNFRRNPLI